MSLSDLASLGSFVSGVAVLVSLVFLYFQLRQLSGQVRQAEKNQRAALSQGYSTRITENVHWFAEQANAELRTRVDAGETAFTAVELHRLRQMLRTILFNFQDVYQQHQSGLIDTWAFSSSVLGTRTLIGTPVLRALWMDVAPTMAPEFRAVVETMLAEMPITKPVDAVAEFNANLALVMA